MDDQTATYAATECQDPVNADRVGPPPGMDREEPDYTSDAARLPACADPDGEATGQTPALRYAPVPVNGNGHPSPHEGHEPTTTEPGDKPDDGIGTPQIIEALLFASDAPLSAARLVELAGGGTPGQVRKHIDALNENYVRAGLTFRIEHIARGYQMMTLPALRPWLQKLEKHRSHTRLSDAALEAAAIVAYKQPIIRADIEAIRGVASGEVLNRLREMGLIRIVGRAEIVGRPMLYGTTRKFLDVFGLADLEDLPPMEALALRRPSREPGPEPVPDEEFPDAPAAVAGA